MQLNENLIKELPRVLRMTHSEISALSDIAIATWYRIVKTPSKISVQQLIDLANGLHIPVSRFLSKDDLGVIGRREDYIIFKDYLDCFFNRDAVQKTIDSGVVSSYREAATKVGLHPNRIKESLLAIHRLPVTRLLNFCSTFNLNFADFVVDPNTPVNLRERARTEALNYLDSNAENTLPEDLLAMRLEMVKLRQQLFYTKHELDTLRQNQNSNNHMAKKEISGPVTWFYGIRFQYDFKDMSEPVKVWFQMLVKKEYPREVFFFAKTGSEYNSICFYTEGGDKFFDVRCQPPLSDCLFREKIMAGRISASISKDNPDAVEFVADLAANLRDDRGDTAELAKFRRDMIQKFG